MYEDYAHHANILIAQQPCIAAKLPLHTSTMTSTTAINHNSPSHQKPSSRRNRRVSELVEPTYLDVDLLDDVEDEEEVLPGDDGGDEHSFPGHVGVVWPDGGDEQQQEHVPKKSSSSPDNEPGGNAYDHGDKLESCRAYLGYETVDDMDQPSQQLHQQERQRDSPAKKKRQSILMESATIGIETSRTSNMARSIERRTNGIQQYDMDPFTTSYRPGKITLYSPPCQRQRWGQKQILPRVDFGDMFFDLFYVGATYNASNVLVDQPSRTGLLYFLGSFLSIMQIWINKTFFDARFVVGGDDLYHRLWEMAHLLLVSNAIVHIQPVDVMSNTTKYVDMFAFSISIALVQVLLITKYVELYFVGRGQKDVIRKVATRDGMMLTAGLVLQLSATIIAGLDFYGNQTGESQESSSHGSEYDESSSSHRMLGTFSEEESTYGGTKSSYNSTIKSEFIKPEALGSNNTPIWLCLFVPVVYWLSYVIRTTFLWPRDGYSHKKFLVPINVSFTIHRDGEWTMLMYGECILSLLIEDVPQEDGNYFWTFYFSLMTVILLQYLHFRSQPHDADDHVFRRSKDRGLVWKVFLFVYASSLVALGASFTLFVRSFASDEAASMNSKADDHRFLAGGGDSAYSSTEMRKRGSYIFSISLSLLFLSMDVMSLMHVGFKHGRYRCYCKESKGYNKIGIILVVTRVGLIAVAASLAWVIGIDSDDDIVSLTGTGFTIAIAQLCMRHLSEKYLPPASQN